MGEKCSIHEGVDKCFENLTAKSEPRDHLGNLYTHGRIILKCIIRFIYLVST